MNFITHVKIGTLIVITIVLCLVESDESTNENQKQCITKETCGDCITENQFCAWCSEEGYTEKMQTRCNTFDVIRTNCHENSITYPIASIHMMKDEELSDKGAKEEDATQIRPQEMRIRLRPHTPVTFNVHFRQAVDYPVDLYYVMDLSNSMKDDKKKLSELGNKLAREMKSITSNFRLGFGSFVDKIAAPYVHMHPTSLKSPCRGCASPYGFHNNMALSSETHRFARKVNESETSGNLDGVEGGFDAIMQAIVCKDEINWRNKSRKLLVFSTDSGFHQAGDGKLAGIISPNDGNCHLDSDGTYVKTASQDYPSISQLNKKIKDHKVNIIFAVTREQVELYKTLGQRLVGSSTGELQGHSSNIVQLIRDHYNKITSSVEMTDDVGLMKNIHTIYHSSCLDPSNQKQETNVCDGLKVGTTVSFDVTVEVSFCPERKHEWNQTFHIFPVGLNEFLTVHLEIICECNCENSWNEERFSEKCNAGNGTYECGICSCYDNRYGKECECDYNDWDPYVADAGCIYGNDTMPCSDRGLCRCSKCYCTKRSNPEEKISGKFCQCDNYGCDRDNGKLCGGLDHGVCECGACKCNKGWAGKDCSCSKTTENCIDANGDLCGNQGFCNCGLCSCHSKEVFGKYCDDCRNCTGKCKDLQFCVDCFMDNLLETDSLGKNCSLCDITILTVEKLEVQDSEGDKMCSYNDNKGCVVSFKYQMENVENQLLVHVQKNKECPAPVDVMAIISGVAGSIVGAGLLLLLLWKILTEIHDRREFVRYSKELENSKWDAGENPIYKPSTSTFQNPAYGNF